MWLCVNITHCSGTVSSKSKCHQCPNSLTDGQVVIATLHISQWVTDIYQTYSGFWSTVDDPLDRIPHKKLNVEFECLRLQMSSLSVTLWSPCCLHDIRCWMLVYMLLHSHHLLPPSVSLTLSPGAPSLSSKLSNLSCSITWQTHALCLHAQRGCFLCRCTTEHAQ